MTHLGKIQRSLFGIQWRSIFSMFLFPTNPLKNSQGTLSHV